MPLTRWQGLAGHSAAQIGSRDRAMMKRLLSGQGARAVQLAVSVSITAGCLWVLHGQLSAGFWHDVAVELRGLDAGAVTLAIGCTCISFFALGRYDTIAHRHLGSGIPTAQACGAGTLAIALAQTLGFGVLTGALARWRMLPDITMALALRLSVFVCLTFMVALLVITAVVSLVFSAPPALFWPSTLIVAALPAAVVALFYYPVVTWGRFTIRLPSLRAFGSILMWTAIDVLAASTALYLLIPGDDVSFGVLLPLFLVALGAALISGTPGGVGPFELVLFTGLPQGDAIEVLSGVIAFRATYYAGPALIAIALMLRPFAGRRSAKPAAQSDTSTAPRAEIGVIRQNGGFVADHCALWDTGQTLCNLFDPVSTAAADPIKTVSRHARARNLIPCLYKCSARTAVVARRRDWLLVLVPHRGRGCRDPAYL